MHRSTPNNPAYKRPITNVEHERRMKALVREYPTSQLLDSAERVPQQSTLGRAISDELSARGWPKT